jgi:uncharacterized protein (TIGR00297 family)
MAYRRRSLSLSGVPAAITIGTTIYGFGGPAWWLLLIAFFASSSALSHLRAAQKVVLAEKFAQASRRDIWQVLANGGLGALLAVVYAVEPWPWLGAAFVGTMATVNADTWATEVGVLSPRSPRLVTTGRPVEPGTSGGISLQGTVAALAGAAYIGLLAGAVVIGQGSLWEGGSLFLAAIIPGLLGALFDSLLGATVQQIYFCDHCRQETERPVHRCQRKTRPLRGWPYLNNDGVNFLSSGVGALVAAGIWGLLT